MATDQAIVIDRLNRFRARSLRPHHLGMIDVSDIDGSLRRVRRRIEADAHEEAREAALGPIMERLVLQMMLAAKKVKTQKLSTAIFADLTLRELEKAWREASREGATRAYADADEDEPEEGDPVHRSIMAIIETAIANRMDQQAKLAERFGVGIAVGVATTSTDTRLATRIGGYARTTQPAYEQAYCAAAKAIDPEIVYVWHAEADACELCAARDQHVYTERDLPCWPGDGGWGEFCNGSHNCRCSLTCEKRSVAGPTESEILAAAHNTQLGVELPAPELTVAQHDALAREARERFIASLPTDVPPGEIYSVQDRARIRDWIRDSLAISRGVDPGEISAADIADHLPPGVSSPPVAMKQAKIDAASLAVVARDTGNVLMSRRGPGPNAGKWEFSGGHLEGSETPWEGAVREWTEEVGARLPTSAKRIGSWTLKNWQCFIVAIPHQAEIRIGSLTRIDDAPAEVRWVAPRDAMKLDLRPEMRASGIPWQVFGSKKSSGSHADLVTESEGSLSEHVYGLLLRHYPAATITWVKQCTWRKSEIAITDITLTRQMDQSDEDRIKQMQDAIEHGFEAQAVVVVTAGDTHYLADGNHRVEALRRSHVESTAAYVGLAPDHMDVVASLHMMQEGSLNEKDATTPASCAASEIVAFEAGVLAANRGEWDRAVALGNAAVAMSDALKPMVRNDPAKLMARNELDTILDLVTRRWMNHQTTGAVLMDRASAAIANMRRIIGEQVDDVIPGKKEAGAVLVSRSLDPDIELQPGDVIEAPNDDEAYDTVGTGRQAMFSVAADMVKNGKTSITQGTRFKVLSIAGDNVMLECLP